MANLNIDEEEHTLQLGRSFDLQPDVAYHSIRYDFKPQSLKKETATVDVAGNGSVSVKIPRVEGSGPAYSEFRGSKKKSQKECVLIIDHVTGTFTLERLSSNVAVKAIRTGGSVNNNVKSVSPTETLKTGDVTARLEPPLTKPSKEFKKKQTLNKSVPLSGPSSVPSSAATFATVNKTLPVPPSGRATKRSLSDASSSSSNSEAEGGSDEESSDSSDDSVTEPSPPVVAPTPSYLPPPVGISQLMNEDLKLSESDSD